MRAIAEEAGETFGQMSFDAFLSHFGFTSVSEPGTNFRLSDVPGA